ncbi:hypothetical protein ACH61_03039 [Rathayibacter tanaceti]|uniref:Uncharacterized protein n=1 Tax=Rathayibacter tanaceti TaxID=1671680 RepID=A0A162GEG8_9MICO|nr:hypothetical protein ACH61_03039 [Rathayibacter tanaceti]
MQLPREVDRRRSRRSLGDPDLRQRSRRRPERHLRRTGHRRDPGSRRHSGRGQCSARCAPRERRRADRADDDRCRDVLARDRDGGRRPRERGHARRAPRQRARGPRHQRQRLRLGGTPRDRRATRRRGRDRQRGALRLVGRRGGRPRRLLHLRRLSDGGGRRGDRDVHELRHGRLAELRGLCLRRRPVHLRGSRRGARRLDRDREGVHRLLRLHRSALDRYGVRRPQRLRRLHLGGHPLLGTLHRRRRCQDGGGSRAVRRHSGHHPRPPVPLGSR